MRFWGGRREGPRGVGAGGADGLFWVGEIWRVKKRKQVEIEDLIMPGGRSFLKSQDIYLVYILNTRCCCWRSLSQQILSEKTREITEKVKHAEWTSKPFMQSFLKILRASA